MAIDWELYEELVNGGTVSGGSSPTSQATGAYEEGLLNDPGYQPNATVNGEVQPIVVKRESSIDAGTISFSGTTLHIGDLIHVYDADWIVTECYVDTLGLTQAVIWLCNATISFQNRTNEIFVRPCIIDDGSYSKRSDPTAYIPTNTYKVFMSMDEATVKMFIDKRLGFGTIYNSEGNQVLEVYKIVGIDLKSKNFGEGSHLMQMLVQRDVYNAETDSLELNLCDVYSEPNNTETEAGSGTCTISGLNQIRIGTKRVYTASFINSDGSAAENVTPVWDVAAPLGVTSSVSDGKCIISVPLNGQLIGQEIAVSLSDQDGTFGSIEKTVEVKGIG